MEKTKRETYHVYLHKYADTVEKYYFIAVWHFVKGKQRHIKLLYVCWHNRREKYATMAQG